MSAAGKPWWQQATAVVSLGASGAITGFSFTPGTAQAAARPSPAQIRLLALQQVANPAHHSDAMLRSAIVNVAQYYLRMSAGKTPAEMEALIWQHDSVDGVDHGPSCAAFASLTLELGSQAIGQQSWVTGGSSYPWPLHDWADVRVDPNPASPAVVSVMQDAQAHGRWHPVGDGYRPQPGDWVLFNGHVEVVTNYAGGVLHTIGGDSLPNFSVNAHEYANPLSAQGVTGFVNNGARPAASGRPPGTAGRGGRTSQSTGRRSGTSRAGSAGNSAGAADTVAAVGAAAVPGTSTPSAAPARAARAGGSGRPAGSAVPAGGSGAQARSGSSASSGGSGGQAPAPAQGQWHAAHPRTSHRPARPVHAHAPGAKPGSVNTGGAGPAGAPGHDRDHAAGTATVPGAAPGAVTLGPAAEFQKAATGGAVIPGLPTSAHHAHGHRAAAPSPGAGTGSSHSPQPPSPSTQAQMTAAQRAFIAEVAPGAVAAAHRYGVPASVTIAQAIDESGWGQSILASKDHNLFGMKGAGPAGTDTQLTQEYENGQWVVTAAPFRAYHSVAQSIGDHGKLLASSDYYRNVMTHRHNPDAFASALTGVYATDPSYGQTLIGLMRQYNLYQYDHAAPPAAARRPAAKPARGKPAPAQRTTAPAAPGQASIPGLAQPGPGSSTGTGGSGTTPGRETRPGASSPPRGTKPAPSSPPRTGRPAPSSPPGSTRPSSPPPPSTAPSPSSPPNSSPAPGPTPSRSSGTGRGSRGNSTPVLSSPPRVARTAPASPARGGQPGQGSAPRTARPASGPRSGGGTPSPSAGFAPGTTQGAAQPGTSSIPGVSQSAPNSTRRPAQPGTGSARTAQPRNGSAGSTVPGQAQSGTAPSGVGSPGGGQPGQSTPPAAPAGSPQPGDTAQSPAAKPLKATLLADVTPAPTGTPATSAPATGTARARVTGSSDSATGTTSAGTSGASAPAKRTARGGTSGTSAPAKRTARGGTSGTSAPASRSTRVRTSATFTRASSTTRASTADTAAYLASAESSQDEAAEEWDPADWVPDWANEANDAADSESALRESGAGGSAAGESVATEPDDTAISGISTLASLATSSGRSGPGGVRGATGLRERRAAARPSTSAAATGSDPQPGQYDRPLPRVVRNAFQAVAEGPLLRAEPMYRDVAGHTGLPWELLAACDWMQCEAKPKHSPVHGEKLGTCNDDGTVYWTKSEALQQCAEDLVTLARTVYGIDLTAPGPLTIRDLANVFAAFRWGELLKVHRTSAMEFPYSVAGLTVQHIGMRWPTINAPKAPDKPGSRFRMHFGAVPVLLSLDYPAMA